MWTALNFKGKLITGSKEKVEALATEYESVIVEENSDQLPNIMPSPYQDMEEIIVSENGAPKQLQELNTNKSTGLDGPSPHPLKMLAHVITPSLTKFSSNLYSKGKIQKTGEYNISHQLWNLEKYAGKTVHKNEIIP